MPVNFGRTSLSGGTLNRGPMYQCFTRAITGTRDPSKKSWLYVMKVQVHYLTLFILKNAKCCCVSLKTIELSLTFDIRVYLTRHNDYQARQDSLCNLIFQSSYIHV